MEKGTDKEKMHEGNLIRDALVAKLEAGKLDGEDFEFFANNPDILTSVEEMAYYRAGDSEGFSWWELAEPRLAWE